MVTIPHDEAHQKFTRWMREEDPIYQDALADTHGGEAVQRADSLWMIYQHQPDRSCCEITNRNREESQPMYTRGPYGEIIRGR
jgi:hypothetical protein